ncbi:hypothetical protein AB1Y20_018959 [Prymnesium parvum]|uniref:ATP-dependent Clp protease proteolytic subunit n=1 Tax=Prymnesium parvum TaxID=97485 RepID=A0AB34JR81_PRYPA
MAASRLLLPFLCGVCAALRPDALLRRAVAPHASRALVKALQAGAASGGGSYDGSRLGPPPDMPSLLLNNRIVYLGMPINAAVTELIIGELLFLQYESNAKPITMYINSPGTTTEDGQPVGFETEAFAIVDTMNYVQAPIHTFLVGKAYGLAAMLLANGEKGQRSGLPYGTVMLHQPRGQRISGQASDIAIRAREVLQNRETALELMSAGTGVTMEKLRKDTNRCLYLDALAAKEYGIIDKIVEKTKMGSADRITASDLSGLSRGLG